MIGMPSSPDVLTAAPAQPDFTYALGSVRFIATTGAIFSLVMMLAGMAGLLPRTVIAGMPDWLVGASSSFGSVLALIAEQPIMGYGLIWVGISDAAVFFWIVLTILRKQRPLAINDLGVFAYYRGEPWRHLAWRDVRGISKEFSRGGNARQQSATFSIEGPDFAIPMTNQINGLADAVASLGRYAHRYGITLRQVDKTRDRKGVVTEIAEL